MHTRTFVSHDNPPYPNGLPIIYYRPTTRRPNKKPCRHRVVCNIAKSNRIEAVYRLKSVNSADGEVTRNLITTAKTIFAECFPPCRFSSEIHTPRENKALSAATIFSFDIRIASGKAILHIHV